MTDLTVDEIITIMQDGDIELEGLMPWGSNYTFLVDVCHPTIDKMPAIYKPRKGERPLWDFDSGTLCLRERAAFLVSQSLGWSIVPPTILRDGPHGLGIVQFFISHDPNEHYFTFEGKFDDQLQQFALFDFIVNNADRKGGHVLLDDTQRLWSIDHGLCFHEEYKLRSVIWDFADMPIPPALLQGLTNWYEKIEQDTLIEDTLGDLLSTIELVALCERTARLVQSGRFPKPGPGRHYPWPPV